MKKWIAIVAAGIMALSFAGCGAGDVGGEEYMASKAAASSQPGSSAQQTDSSTPPEAAYENSFKGLQQYMTDKGVVSGTAVSMEGSLIGAAEGVKYVYGYEGKENVTLELYRFDSANLGEKGQQTISSIKENGKFTIMQEDVPAILNGDYLMVYTDTQTGEANVARANEVKDIFMGFGK